MTDQPTERESVVYDAIDAFQRTHRLPGLQHAQIRGLLAEHLARVLPAAFADLEPVVPVSSPPPDQTALRERGAKAEALLLHFTAEAHRRKWNYDRGLADDGQPVRSEAFDALHRRGQITCPGAGQRPREAVTPPVSHRGPSGLTGPPPPDEPAAGRSCDGGYCDAPSVGWRLFRTHREWLPVCGLHMDGPAGRTRIYDPT